MAGDGFTLESQTLGALPVVNHFLGRLRLGASLDRCVPADDARLRLAPAAVLGVVVRNLAVQREPVYAIGEWASPYDPELLGLVPGQADALNDDRVGRMLARLFDADRASLLTEVVLRVIREFGVDVSQLHNDSTSVTFTGVYAGADGASRGGKATPAVAFGHNKDHRPDLKQLLWILTVSADGAVPITYRVADGNVGDDATHIPTWDELAALAGRTDFLYVADCKLATRAAMAHIHEHGGRFVTVLPATRGEDGWFRDWAQTHTPDWAEAGRRPGRRHGDPDDVWRTFTAPLPSAEGHRVIWVHSSSKAARDAHSRQARIEAGVAAAGALAERVARPKSRLRTGVAVEQAAAAALADAGASRWLSVEVTETVEETYRQERRGRPGAITRYRRHTTSRFAVTCDIRLDVVAHDAATDGCFPLITNDTAMTPAEVLAAYKYQPNLERRHAQLKGHQLVAPVFLKDPARIEGLLCCHFFALVTQALIERQIRAGMTAAATRNIPLYPEFRACAAPSAARVLEIFAGVARHHLISDGRVVQTFEPTLTPLQLQVLDLLDIPASAYASSP